jgi:ankyrin repeat protein
LALLLLLSGKLGLLRYMLDNKAYKAELKVAVDIKNQTLLHLVCQRGSVGMAKLLLEAGLDPKVTDSDGLEPSFFLKPNSPLIILMPQSIDIVFTLL